MARKTASVEVRSEQLAQAVVDILAEQGRGALTREKISERAGLSRPLIYYYFNSAEAVLASSFRWICHKLLVREEQMAGKAEAGSRVQMPSIVEAASARPIRRTSTIQRIFAPFASLASSTSFSWRQWIRWESMALNSRYGAKEVPSLERAPGRIEAPKRVRYATCG